jgi:MFS family permease
VLVLVATLSATFTFAGTDLGIVAALKAWGETGMTGLIVALLSAGSAVGGFIYGAMSRSFHPLVVVLGLAAVTAPCALAGNGAMLGVAVFIAGLLCAPTFTAINTAFTHLVPEGRLGEAMGWNGTAMTVGTSLGSPVCGFVIDRAGAWAAFVLAAALGAIIAITGLVIKSRRAGGSLRRL